jgi:putative intracellular protease/amidase/methionine-rich copper-binding protein CopC
MDYPIKIAGKAAVLAAMFRRTLTLLTVALVLTSPATVMAQTVNVDFDAAFLGVNFDPLTLDGNGSDVGTGNGMPDAAEMALVSAVLRDNTLDLSASGGIRHTDVLRAYEQALASATADVETLVSVWPTVATLSAGYMMLGQSGFDFIDRMARGFGVSHKGDYSLALITGTQLTGAGDADGDGISNLQEYLAFGRTSIAEYVSAALDPSQKPASDQITDVILPESNHKTIGVILYPGFEVLDVYGPVEMWANVPEFNVIMIAEEQGPVMSAQGVATIADYSFDNAPALDIVMVPGGIGTRTELLNETFLSYLRQVHAESEYTTSVCTGSALLAKAGILDGLSATSNKRAFYLAEEQSSEVDWIVDARWVESGKVLTSSGVSAGIDMALGLVAKTHGINSARMLASTLEYIWHEDADNDPFAQFAQRSVLAVTGSTLAFENAEPAAGVILDTAPRFLQLFFDNTPDVARSSIMLQQIGGDTRSIQLNGLHTMSNRDLMISVAEPLADGHYTVTWSSATAGGGTQTMGSYQFEVKTNSQ